MTYVVDVSLALIRVLDRAAFFRDERLAGYAANADFWANEVRHALDVIAGYDTRVAAWNQAAKSTVADSESVLSVADAEKLKAQLRASATRFFRLCWRHLDRGQVIEIEQLLEIRIEHQNVD